MEHVVGGFLRVLRLPHFFVGLRFQSINDLKINRVQLCHDEQQSCSFVHRGLTEVHTIHLAI